MWSLIKSRFSFAEKAETHAWKPAFYQKLDLEFPEASHFGEVPGFLHGLVYDPITDEFSYRETAEPTPPVISLALRSFFAAVVGVYSLRSLLLFKFRGSFRRLITDHLGSEPNAIHSYERLRRAFTSTEFFNVLPQKDHSHPMAASCRASAARFATSLCYNTGLNQYQFQMSRGDQKGNQRGCRTYYWAKDVTAFPQHDELEPNDFITMIDVDYYVDMITHLANEAHPHLLYTVQPEHAGFVGPDYSYSFTPESNIVWKVSGGATYTHQLWNYSIDWFTVSLKCCGVPYKTVTYDVQSRRISPDKQLVLLSPIKVTYGLSAILTWMLGRELSRLDTFVSGGFSKVAVAGKERLVSVARCGFETSCTVALKIFESLVSIRNISPKEKLNLYQVKSLFKTDEELIDIETKAPILTDYFNNAVDRRVDVTSVTERPNLTAFAFDFPDPSDKPCMEPFAKPFVPPAFVPLDNKASSDQSVAGRILLPRKEIEELLGGYKSTPTKTACMHEFVKRLVPKPHAFTSLDFNSVAEKQIKPGQRKDLQEAGFFSHIVRTVKTFMKKEAYGKPTDTRNITTFNPLSKIDYASFMYPVMDHMKNFPFYAFGKTPLEVANRVAEVAAEAKQNLLTPDIHRMDGFVNTFCRQLELCVGLRFFSENLHDQFSDAHNRAYNNVGITTHGTRYDQEASRGSGEMGTSVWNTIINLFIIFYARYLQTHDYDDSWQYLINKVLAGGDDGVNADMDPALLIRAGRDIGFIIKCPDLKRGAIGVNFLARIYGPEVWNGDPNSMCSLKRQMEKFHLTPHLNIPAFQKLFEKSESFYLTDANTPIIGPLVTKVIALTKGYTNTKSVTRYGDDFSKDVQYPNIHATWMDEVAKSELPLLNIGALSQWIEEVKTLDDIVNPPCFYEEGREFTYSEWDPQPGLLIARTKHLLKTLSGKKYAQPVKPAVKTPPPVVEVVDSKVKN